MAESGRLHVLLAGDVIESAGTRSYLREMLKHLKQVGLEVSFHCFQFRLSADMPAGLVSVDDFDDAVYVAPGGRLFSYLPRPLYRLYERLVLWRFLRQRMRLVEDGDVLIGSGCLGALYLTRCQLPHSAWWLKLGLIEEEGTGTLRYRLRKRIEAMHARHFVHRIVVSEPMGAFIASEYGQACGQQLVLPCLVDLQRFPELADRDALRQSLGLAQRLVLAYVGTASPWQCAEETVSFFKLVAQQVPQAFFWVFTPDRQKFESLLSDLPQEQWRVEFRPHHELAGLLPAADAGCLVRRRIQVNRVASPLKFPEYLSCGLPVLIGPEVGHYSQLVRTSGLGAVIDPDRPQDWPQVVIALKAVLAREHVRQDCRKQAESLSWQSFAPTLAQAFVHQGIKAGESGVMH